MPDKNDHPAALPDRPPTLRVMPTPADVNGNGDIFGGWIMAQADIACGIAAMRRSRGRVVTVAVNSFQFKQPVSVGDIVSLYADVVETGRTSMKINVEVYAERHPAQPITVKVTEATLTFVAINQQGEKRLLPDDQQ
jgi:acyl-CoA thioesterase YciA